MTTRWCQPVMVALVIGLLSLSGAVLPAVADEGPTLTGTTAPDASPESGSTGNAEEPSQEAKDEEGAEPPEISVEVVGKKWGEQAVPSLMPSTGEVLSSVTSEELEATGESSLTDALQFLPSFTVVHQGRRFERMVRIRGSSVPTILLDGALVGLGDFAQRVLYTLPLSAVERIDVIRSSSSLIYGPQALTGGVINIITKSGKGPAQFDLSGEAGSFDYVRYGTAFGEGTDDRANFLAADQEVSESNLEFGSRRMQHLFYKSTRSYENGADVKFSVLSIDGRRSLDVWSDEYQAVTGAGPAYWTFNPWREQFYSLAYVQPLRRADSGVDFLLWYRDRRYRQWWFDGPIPAPPNSSVYSDENDETVGGSIIARLPLSEKHFLRLGTQGYRLNGYSQSFVLRSGTIAPDPPASSDTELMSYFLQDEWALSAQTRLFYGGRYETPKDRDNAFVYAIGLERDLPRDAHFYARLGTGVQNPTQAQLENDPTLLDQTSQNYDAGVERVFNPRLMGRLGWFRAAIANDFIDYLRPGGDPTKRQDYRTAQTDRTVSGWELEFQGGRRKLSWFANWSHTTQDVSETPTIGDQPIQVAVPPQNQLNLGIRCPLGTRTKLAVSYSNVADYLARARYFTGGWPIEGYQVTNLTMSHELPKGWRLTAKMDNLLDEEYETQPGFPRPGRNWAVGLSCTIPIPQSGQ